MNWYRNYLLPGLIFQSVVIGGGYATGRELIEFFLPSGPIGGLLGLLVAGLVFGVVLAAGFEFARVFRVYDYRHFCKALLGPAWFLFEIAFLLLLLLILSVIGSAAGEMLAASFGLPPLVGTLVLMSAVALLTFTGTEVIKRILASWSFLLYVVYALIVVLAFKLFGDDIRYVYAESGVGRDWFSSGVLYSGYNLALLPAVLFAVTQQTRRRQAIGAGLIAGLVAIVPAMCFYVVMMSAYPVIGDEPVPASFLMTRFDMGWLSVLFQVVVFGTFIETGTALLHAVNERVDGWMEDAGKTLPRTARPLIALGFLLIAVFAAANFGIIDLIAQGYNALTLVFLVVLIVPLLTVGLWRVSRVHAVDVAAGTLEVSPYRLANESSQP